MFAEFTGQRKTVERLQLMVEAARQRGEALQHILLSGPPGLGKTTLAYIIGNAMGVAVKSTSGPMIEKAGDLAGLLTNIERGGVLFIDEIHRLQPAIEEYLYPAMEDFKLDIVIDQGPSARSIRLNLARFTLIGATTRAGMISAPLRSRFGMTCRLDYYEVRDLQKIVERSAGLLDAQTDRERRARDRATLTRDATDREQSAPLGRATMPKCAPEVRSPVQQRRKPSPCWKLTRMALTKWTSASSRVSSHCSTAGRSA